MVEKFFHHQDVALNMGKHSGMFTQPTAMTEAEIEDVIARL